jgi:hypothetical protein
MVYPKNKADGKDGDRRHKETRKGNHDSERGLLEHALSQFLSTNVIVRDITLSIESIARRLGGLALTWRWGFGTAGLPGTAELGFLLATKTHADDTHGNIISWIWFYKILHRIGIKSYTWTSGAAPATRADRDTRAATARGWPDTSIRRTTRAGTAT